MYTLFKNENLKKIIWENQAQMGEKYQNASPRNVLQEWGLNACDLRQTTMTDSCKLLDQISNFKVSGKHSVPSVPRSQLLRKFSTSSQLLL